MIDEVRYLRDGLAERDAEIERLRALACGLAEGRNAVIEECARVADGFGDKYYFMSAVDIAAAIRGLKSNTGG